MSIRTEGDAVQHAASSLGGRARRLVEYLAHHPDALTAEIARDCACGNVSDAASRANLILETLGFAIVGKLPTPPTKNRFGQVSMQNRWRIEPLP